jgi:predicted permease
MSFLVTALTLLGPVVVGYLCVRYGLLQRQWSKRIQRTTVLFLAPPVMFLTMWSLKIPGVEILGVPAIAMLCGVGGMVVAYPIARGLGLSRQGIGAFIIAAGWSNTWLIGGYVSFQLYGQQGYALASLYNVLNPFLTYMVGFAVAGSFSPDHTVVSTRDAVRNFFTDPVSIAPNIGMLAGLAVNLLGIEPGAWSADFTAYVVPSFTVVSMFAVGMTMSFRRTREYLRPLAAQAAIKYVLWPALTLGAIFLIRGSLLHDPVTFRVLLIQSLMPVSMQALMLCNLFDLDMDLVNALWLGTNLFSLATMPLLVYFVQL